MDEKDVMNSIFSMADNMNKKQQETVRRTNELKFSQWLTDMCYKYEKQPEQVINDFKEALELVKKM